MEKNEIRIILRYEFQLGHSAAEAKRNMDIVYETESPSKSTVCHWFQNFGSGDLALEDEPGRGRKSSLDNDKIEGRGGATSGFMHTSNGRRPGGIPYNSRTASDRNRQNEEDAEVGAPWFDRWSKA